MANRFQKARSLALDITPLRVSVPYRALWVGQTISLIGNQMRLVALAYQVFQVTGSTVAVGLISLAELVPLIGFSILGGAIADVVDRRKLTGWASIGMLAASVGLAWVSFVPGEPSVWWLYMLAAAGSAFAAIERPARTAMAPNLVGLELMPSVMALRQLAFQTTQIVGPAIGGLVIAAVGGEVAWVYVIDSITFFSALASLRWVPSLPPQGPVSDQTRWQAIKEGFTFTRRRPVVMSIFVVDLVAMVFGMPRAVFPALAERTFASPERVLGLLYAAPAVGALAATVTTGWVRYVRREGRAVLIAVVLWGACITLAGLSLFSLALTLLFLTLAGGADVISAVFRGSMLLEVTPDHLRGRVSALNLMVVTGGPRLGDVEAGLVAGVVGAPASVVIGGIVTLVGTAGVARLFPSLRGYERAVAQTSDT